MRSSRCCSRNGCDHPSVATLTYVYADSTAVLGPLAAYPEPHSYDLCQAHAQGLTAPRGWDLVKHERDLVPDPAPADDLLALADAVREPAADPERKAASGPRAGHRRPRPYPGGSPAHGGRRGHLRAIPPPDLPTPG